ncbi:hypothetical protein C0989_004873 [Termitomyces sp. Mn162]|nr:hypothetical protein C0989_004873 [Termitomyces sp. Mn162]
MTHLLGVLVVARGEEQSKGCRGEDRANCGDIREAGPSTPKIVAGGIGKELVTSPRVATTPRSKEKGKGKAQEEEEDFEVSPLAFANLWQYLLIFLQELIEDSFTNKHLETLPHWWKASMVVDMGMAAGMLLEKAKGKSTVSPERQQVFK